MRDYLSQKWTQRHRKSIYFIIISSEIYSRRWLQLSNVLGYGIPVAGI